MLKIEKIKKGQEYHYYDGRTNRLLTADKKLYKVSKLENGLCWNQDIYNNIDDLYEYQNILAPKNIIEKELKKNNMILVEEGRL